MKLHEETEHSLSLVNDDRNLQLIARWDGCVDIRNWANGDTVDTPVSDEMDYIHICELAEFINQLQELEAKAKEKFYMWREG